MSMVQAFSYNFSIIENPLSDGGKFATISDVDFTGVLKVVNAAGNLCVPVAATSPSGAVYVGPVAAPGGVWPADQYSELTMSIIGDNSDIVWCAVRQGSPTSGTQYLVNITTNPQTIAIFAIVAGVQHILLNVSQANAQGDVFRLMIVGNVLTLFRNGAQVQTVTDTNNFIATGSPGFALYTTNPALTTVGTRLWAAGANQSATPTFIVAGGGPTTITVQITSTSGGTIYYTTDGTTPTESSSSIASGGTVVISRSATLKAIASATNFLDSLVGSFFSPTAATLQFAGLLW
jgi:hypothetical protein